MTTTNTFRYQYGDSNPICVPWKPNFPINIGDMVYTDPTDTVTLNGATLYPTKSAAAFTWQSQISDPAAGPTGVASVALGPGFTAGATYKVEYTYVTADGAESGPSPLSSAISLSSGQGIYVSGVAVPAGIKFVNWYVTASNGSTPQLVQTTPYGAGTTIVGPPPSDAPAPPAASNLSPTLLTQIAFNKQFVGNSGQFYDGTSTPGYGVRSGLIRVDTGGTFLMDCAAASFNDGDLVGLAKDTGNALAAQTVVAVAYKAAAIGRVKLGAGSTNQLGSTLTQVEVEIFPPKQRISQVNF